jgi:LysM repeat protein
MGLRDLFSEFSLWQKCVVILLAAAIFGGTGYFARIVARPPELDRFQSIPWVTYVHPNVKKLKQAQGLASEGKLLQAQALLTEALITEPRSPVTRELRDLLGNVNTRIFFSKEPSPRKTEYVVKRGDSLASIAQRLGSSVEAIMRVNGLDSTLIRPGDKLMVPRLDFSMTIDLPSNRVIVHDAQGFFTQYPIVSAQLARSRRPMIQTAVTAKSSLQKGRPWPENGSKKEATPRIDLRRSGYVLYGIRENKVASNSQIAFESSVGGENLFPDGTDEPPQGIAMLQDDIAEVGLLVRKGTPVTIILNPEQTLNEAHRRARLRVPSTRPVKSY